MTFVAPQQQSHTRHCEERSDEAIQLRAKARQKEMQATPQGLRLHFLARLPARGWIASLRSQ
jgi:hypothetical protein